MLNISLSVFFPAYNEADNIEKTIRTAKRILQTITKTYEIIIVDDGSTDKTGQIADELATADPTYIRVVHHAPNQGYGAALKSGFAAARYDYVFFSDSDLQFDLAEIEKLLAFVPEYDAVIGYRAPRRDPFFRLMNAKLWAFLNRLLFGLRVKDIDCAFKLFRRDAVRDLPLKSGGAMLSAELLIRLQRQGIRFKQVPVTHRPSNKKTTTGASPKVIWRAFKELAIAFNGGLSRPVWRQFVLFSLIGGVNTVGDIGLYLILTRLTPWFAHRIIAAKAVTFVVFSFVSFLANRRLTFRAAHPPHLKEIIRFFSTAGTGLMVNVTGVFVFLRLFRFYDIAAVVAATAVSWAWNFSVQKFWVFRPKRAGGIATRDGLVLASLAAIVIVNAYFWLRIDTIAPHWDMANHLRHSLEYTDVWRTQVASSTTLRGLAKGLYNFFVDKETYYPPFAYWLSVPWILALGRTFRAAVLSNVFFLFVTIFSVYGLAVRLWNRQIGLLAVVVMLSFPFIVGQFHEFQLDMPLTAMTAFSVFALVKSRRWQNRWWSFVFGAASGLGMLAKWPLPAFVVGPFVYELVGRLREIGRLAPADRRLAFKALAQNLGLSALGWLITAGPWYGRHALSLKKNLDINWQTGTGEGDPPPLSVRSLRLYSDVLIQAQIRLLMLVPFIVGLVVTFARRPNLKKNGLLIAWFVGSYIVMTIYNNKDYRFIEPVLGAVAILAVFWIFELVRPAQTIAVGYIIVVAIFQFVTVSWGQRWWPRAPEIVYAYAPDIQNPLHNRFRLTVWQFAGYGSASPIVQNWHQGDILDAVDRDAAGRSPVYLAMYYEDQAFFNRENMAYAIASRQRPYRIRDGGNATWDCYNIDYVIATDKGGVADFVSRELPFREDFRLKDPGGRHTTPFCRLDELGRYVLPNQQGVYLWKVHLLRPKPAPGQL